VMKVNPVLSWRSTIPRGVEVMVSMVFQEVGSEILYPILTPLVVRCPVAALPKRMTETISRSTACFMISSGVWMWGCMVRFYFSCAADTSTS